jgi:hypothetical protein
MPKKVSKKKVSSTKSSRSLNWHEEGEVLLKSYLTKFKNPKSCIAVLSSYGDLLMKSGKGEKFDWTSIGSIFSAVKSAAESLNGLLSNRSSVVQFGDLKSGYWIEWHPGNSFLVGIGVPYHQAGLALLKKHLKANSTASSRKSAEALDGMSEASVEAALETESV